MTVRLVLLQCRTLAERVWREGHSRRGGTQAEAEEEEERGGRGEEERRKKKKRGAEVPLNMSPPVHGRHRLRLRITCF